MWQPKGKQTTIISLIIVNIALTFGVSSCSQTPLVENMDTSSVSTDETDETIDYEKIADLVDICDLSSNITGDIIRVEGKITFLNTADPEGIYFDVESDDCQVGVWLESRAVETLSEEQQDLLVMDGEISVSGMLDYREGEYFLAFDSLGKPVPLVSLVDPTEKWWLKPQTYHNGEGSDLDLIPLMNITVLHDWGSLLEGFAANPDEYWTEASIRERWDEAHAKGMRVEAVLSIIDMWFVEYGPEDEVYEFSGIDLYGNHIEYDDPVGFVGCTNLHGWQEFTKEKIFKAIDWGADGIIIDDYEGSSRWTSGVTSGMGGSENGPGGCFCSACEAGFREYLKDKYTSGELADFEISNIESFDYSEYLNKHGWTIEDLGVESRKFQGWDAKTEIIIPFYQDYADFQNREVVKFLEALRDESKAYAMEKYGREISWSENAGEVTYGAHKSYPYFDRNVGAIWQFGYPPKGSEGYYYRLGFDLYGAPRLREVNRHPVVVAVMNEYQTNNLWLIKSAEAYANTGALIEYDYVTIEGASDEVALASLTNNPETKNLYNTFFLENETVFDFNSLESLAKTAVFYSSPSVHYDMYRHTQSFNGICEILTDLHVQFDPIFIGDGITYPDSLTAEDLRDYELIFLPNVYALTDNQAERLIEFMNAGGSIIALGDFAIVNENKEPLNNAEMLSVIGKENQPVGSGYFTQKQTDVFSADGVVEENLRDIAAVYYQYYIEDNHPLVEQFFYLIDEEPNVHISDVTAAGIREEISGLVESAVTVRMVQDNLSENIAVQAYAHSNPEQIIVHLLNYNYDLETDTVIEQENIKLGINVPEDFDVTNISLISPDIEGREVLDFTNENGFVQINVPFIYIWNVIFIE
jgi:hypothetical protein